MKYSMLLKSSLFLILLLFLGCGNNKTKISGIDDLPGFWIFDMKGTFFAGTIIEESNLEVRLPIIISKNGDSISLVTRKNCKLTYNDAFTITCIDNISISANCNEENKITLQGKFLDYSIEGTWMIGSTYSGSGCDETVDISGTDTIYFSGEKVEPNSEDNFKISGTVGGTLFDYDTNQVLCVGYKEGGNYGFLIEGQDGSDIFEFIFDVNSSNGKISADNISFVTNDMPFDSIYWTNNTKNFNIINHGNVTKVKYALDNWNLSYPYEITGNINSINPSDTLAGNMNLHCHIYSVKSLDISN